MSRGTSISRLASRIPTVATSRSPRVLGRRRRTDVNKLTRAAPGAIIALALALLAAAPAAAAQPTRTVYELHYPYFTIQAGNGCPCAVEGPPAWGFQASAEFSDGSVQWSVRAHGAYVNPANGDRYWVEDNWR